MKLHTTYLSILLTLLAEEEPFLFTKDKAGITFLIKVTPCASKNAIFGAILNKENKSVLKIPVKAAAIAGKANGAVVSSFAKSWGLKKRAITNTQGTATRYKRVHISNDPHQLLVQLGKKP